ncbi:thiol peroxidase [Corynebacterium sp. NML130628]|uniref:thiol peroxidase n=1 Tax=Corynebacterium sp. NML130628 TaxID=1906333 RepID=UPI0008FB1217|nr:thiol peroxidase [Corynebacterium sp. NML130628]OIR45554.1 lipid hydroperoxide peroxidase [Corynebacterium sp. NML130628]
MAKVFFQGNETQTSGSLPKVGDTLPDAVLVAGDLSEKALGDYQGKRLVLNIFPSLDTDVCAKSVRAFNELAGSAENTAVLCISRDLPFAQQRFCAAEGIENVEALSAFRSDFGEAFGLTLEGSPLKGLLARAVIVTDADHRVTHVELVEEITNEPDYSAAEAALS